MGHHKHWHRVGLHLPPGMSEAEQYCLVCGDKSYVILHVLQIKLCPALKFSPLGATWHEDSVLCAIKQHNFAT